MEIRLLSPRGIRCVINAGWEGLEGHLHSQRTPKTPFKPGCFVLAHNQKQNKTLGYAWIALLIYSTEYMGH